MAHWDHLGRAPVLTGDSIFNGAQDNATGVAGILSIARGFQAMLSAPARSVMFIAFTAEESGLVGSEFYARNPLAPLEKTVAAINIDSLYPLGRARDLQVIGSGASDLEDRLAAAAAAQDRILIPDQNPEAGFFYRSDQVSLARRGVPVLYVRSGLDLIDKPAGTGQAMVAEYFASRYHRQTDDYEPTWDVSGSIEDLRLLYEVGASLAADTAWASWYPGNEFSAVRDASAAARAAAP
jgi:Zn-dependent M28 family amino/carboxypeptidase